MTRSIVSIGSLCLLAVTLLSAVQALAAAPSDRAPAALMQHAATLSQAGQHSNALALWQEAAAGYRAAGDLHGEAKALWRKGESYTALGRYPKAVATLEEALALAEQAKDATLSAQVAGSLGSVYLLTGELDAAEDELRKAADAATEAGRSDIAAAIQLNLANVFTAENRVDEATILYTQIANEAGASGNGLLAAKALVNHARALQQHDDFAGSLPVLEQARGYLEPLPPSHGKAYTALSIGRLYAALPASAIDPATARRHAYTAFQSAAATARAIDDARALSYALGYTGELYERAARYDEAQQLTRQALHQAQQSGAPEVLYRWEWQAGRLLKAQGDLDGAIVAYHQSIRTLETIRNELATGYVIGGTSFRERVGPVYLELADLLLRQASAKPGARDQYLDQVRETVELLKGAELEDYFQDDCVAALKAKTTGIDQLAPRTAAIYPIILPDRLEILLSLPDGMTLHTVDVDGARLNREILKFRQRLEKRTTHQYRRHAKRLYDWLIRPIEKDLESQDIETLVIVPDGTLRLIPLAALHDGEHFLIRRYRVATTPGLTLTDPKPIEREEAKILISGLTEGVQGFPPLPNVAGEITTIQNLYGGTVLEDQTFTQANLEAQLAENHYAVVHIASHGQFRGELNDTFVLTYDGRVNMDELGEYMARTAYRQLPVELLTLSACQTAAGDDRAALGLAGIAVKSGARSALATLWYINDEASSMLVAEFYRQLSDPAVSKAEALRRAQLMLLDDNRYRHPSYWAPFLVIGNWL